MSYRWPPVPRPMGQPSARRLAFVQHVLMWLIWYRRVIVLSADRRRNPAGVRTLLNRQVGDVLNRDTSHGLSLTLLLKQPNTTVGDFGRGVEDYLRREPFTAGFREHRI